MSRRGANLIILFIFGFAGGILAASFFVISPLVSIFILFLGGVILLAEKIWEKKVRIEIVFISILLTAFSLGAFRYAIKDFHQPDPALENAVGDEVVLEGLVTDEPEKRDNDTRIILKTENEKVLVRTDLYSPIKYGDTVRVSGKLGKPGVIDEGDGRPFNYAAYLAKDNIYYTMSFAEAEVLSTGGGNSFRNSLLKIKESFVRQMKEILPEPESSLLAGLIVAGKDALPKNILEEFRRAGPVHIVVLSGYNITIIAEFIRRAFSFLAFKIAVSASFISVLLFILMTGGSSTVVRAGIMALIAISGKAFGRSNYSAYRALLAAGFLMVLINPKILVFDPSFQLSFLATLALIFLVPTAEKFLIKIPEGAGLRGIIATTLATQAAVLPFLTYSMGDVSVVSLISNILVLIFIPVTMLLGFLATTLSYISTLLALPLSYITHLLLSYILGVSHFLGNLPLSSVRIRVFPLWLVLSIYSWVVIWIAVGNKKERADAHALKAD